MIANQDTLSNIFVTVETNTVLKLEDFCMRLYENGKASNLKKTEREMRKCNLLHQIIEADELRDEHGRRAKQIITTALLSQSRKKRRRILFAKLIKVKSCLFLFYHDARGSRRWIKLGSETAYSISEVLKTIADKEHGTLCLLER